MIGIGLGCTIFSLINRARMVSRDEHDEVEEKNKRLEDSLKATQSALKLTEERLFDQKNLNEKQSIQIENLQEKVTGTSSAKSRIEAEKVALEEKLKTQKQELIDLNEARKQEILELHKTSQIQFQNIANQILDEKSKKFTESNKINIEALLKPLGENIESFKKRVEETYDKESKQRFSLEEQVKNLLLETNKISSEANNLASALKGQNKKQGNWGEMILETILQNSGLICDVHYLREENIKGEDDKNLRPDFIVKLPNERAVIIDSKTSLTAYEKFCSAENLAMQEFHLKDHLSSIRNHIEILSEKKYDDLDASLDFTMMFIPIEPAYLAAIQADPQLWNYAYQKRILLTSPTNLIVCLKLVNDLWRREEQSKNQAEILRQAGNLYDKFIGFVESMEKVGRQIGSAQNAYEEAVKQLNSGKGNLISRAENLRKLGIKTTKNLKTISEKILPDEIAEEEAVE